MDHTSALQKAKAAGLTNAITCCGAPSPLLPSFDTVIGFLLHVSVFIAVLLYSSVERLLANKAGSKARNQDELHIHKDRQTQNGSSVQCPPAISSERLKDFGEDCLSGDLSTWEMKIADCSEKLLGDTLSPVTHQSAELICFEDISAAAFKIQSGIQKTQCMYSRLSKQYGMDIYLKKEYLQYTGSMKERGVLYLLISLQQEQQQKGVIVASESNFAMAVAYHASELHIPVFVIMPTSSSPVKMKRCREYGAMVISFGTTAKDSQSHAKRLAQENAYLYIEEEDSAAYLAGLGTVGLEIYEQVPKLDVVLLPAGAHSGLLAGSAAALKHLNPCITVIEILDIKGLNCKDANNVDHKCMGIEPDKFPILQQSLKRGYPATEVACINHPFYRDIGGPCFGTNALQLCKKYVDKVISVREEDILIAMLRLLEYERATVDAEGAIGFAGLISGRLPELKGKRVAVTVCSGNLELCLLRQCVTRALTLDKRICKFTILLPDCPREISKLLETLAREEVRVLDVTQEHVFVTSDLFNTEVICSAETRDQTHKIQLRNVLSERYPTMRWLE